MLQKQEIGALKTGFGCFGLSLCCFFFNNFLSWVIKVINDERSGFRNHSLLGEKIVELSLSTLINFHSISGADVLAVIGNTREGVGDSLIRVASVQNGTEVLF